MPYFFYGTKIIHSFSPETKKRHQISLDGHQTKAIPIFNVVVFIHFPSKKSVSEIVRRRAFDISRQVARQRAFRKNKELDSILLC